MSLPDDLFAQAEQLAKRLKVSRSELYSHALREYVLLHATQPNGQAVARVGKQDRAFVAKAARRAFERAKW